ncbi:hypothetical protein LIER_06497 [Lithospermum erythrorhizon]|uniref:Pectinesterase inhibitor domain-containing protein n=1 Tax=Lithospermum erythrorhizon TaxID=34254 RepID=A0AAV3P6D5_LITER
MSFNKKHVSLVMLLGIFALSFAIHADANQQSAINPFCTEGDVTPQMRALCTKMIGSATKWDQAAIASVNRISRKANRSVKHLLSTIEAKLAPSVPISKKSQIMQICKKGYQEAIEGLQECSSLITVGPFTSYATTLTSIYTSFEDCKDAIVEEKTQPEIFEVTRFTKSIQRLVDVALIISKKDPRAAEYNDKLSKGEFKDSAGDPSLIGPINPTIS